MPNCKRARMGMAGNRPTKDVAKKRTKGYNYNCPHKDRPHKANGFCNNCYALKWKREHKDEYNNYMRKYRAGSSLQTKRTWAFSVIRTFVKRGIITKDEVLKVLEEDK